MSLVSFAVAFNPLYNGLPQDSDGNPQFTNLQDILIIVGNVIQILLWFIAILAVIYLMVAGIKYIISEGDPGKVSDAKTGINNAIIGLILSSGAYIIVHFLLGKL